MDKSIKRVIKKHVDLEIENSLNIAKQTKLFGKISPKNVQSSNNVRNRMDKKSNGVSTNRPKSFNGLLKKPEKVKYFQEKERSMLMPNDVEQSSQVESLTDTKKNLTLFPESTHVSFPSTSQKKSENSCCLDNKTSDNVRKAHVLASKEESNYTSSLTSPQSAFRKRSPNNNLTKKHRGKIK